MKEQSTEKLFPTTPVASHLNILHGSLNVDAAKDKVAKQYDEIMSKFGAAWSADLELLTKQVEDSCPAWTGFRESLLDHKEVVENMCNNPHYGKIGPLANELRSQIKLIKSLHADRRGVGDTCCLHAPRLSSNVQPSLR